MGQHLGFESRASIIDADGEIATMILVTGGDRAVLGHHAGQSAQALEDHRHMMAVDIHQQLVERLLDNGLHTGIDIRQSIAAICLEGRGEINHILFIFFHIGLKTGEVKDIIDHQQQLVGAMLDLIDEDWLILLVVFAGKESGIADDVIQRGTNLITHIGEEGLFQQLRLLGLLGLDSQALLGFHHIGNVAIGAKVALHLALLVQHGHHIEEQPYLAAFLIAYLDFDGLNDASLREVVHPVERTVHRSAEAW